MSPVQEEQMRVRRESAEQLHPDALGTFVASYQRRGIMTCAAGESALAAEATRTTPTPMFGRT